MHLYTGVLYNIRKHAEKGASAVITTTETLILAPVALQLIGLFITVQIDPYIRRRDRRIMLLIAALILCLILQNLIDYRLLRTVMPTARTVVAVVGYTVRPVILLLFGYILSDRKNHRVSWILVGINTLVHLTAFFSPICFCYYPDQTFYRGPLGLTCHLVSALLLIKLLYLTLKKGSEERWGQVWIPLINAGLIAAATVADTFLSNGDIPLTFLTITMVSTSLFYYIWLHLQFVREHEHDLMAEQRIRIMMSQIRPHFLYNTLATIRALCRKDPEMAAETTEKLGSYLRQNLDSLGHDGLIPFDKELEHTKIYAEIEQVRFDTIRIEYDIRDNGFSVPSLTLQPLVENAIRHGVRVRAEGLIRVSTQRTADGHEIVVEDNGKGFDMRELNELDESHIGIRNVKERLEKLCGGTLTIDSRPGEGTRAVIFVPAEN